MILSDYYRFERLAEKSKSRMDCTASTESYPEFEDRRAIKAQRVTEKRDAINIGDLILYYSDVPTNFNGNRHRKADKCISLKSKNLSSIFMPDITCNYGYGDFVNTSDALLFLFHDFSVINGKIQAGSVMEIFVARGKNRECLSLFNMLCDGELDEEMDVLRKQVAKNSNLSRKTVITLY